jgi:agmatine/peptidylarginine deiminase
MKLFHKLTIQYGLVLLIFLLSSCGGLSRSMAKQTSNPCLNAGAFLIRSNIANKDCQNKPINAQSGPIKYQIIPEYRPVSAVMVSENLEKIHHDKKLILALLQEDIKVWFLTAKAETFRQYSDSLARELRLGSQKIKNIQALNVQTLSAWTRDWAPLFAAPVPLRREPQLHLVDPYYYRTDADMSNDDSMPAQLQFEIKNKFLLGKDIEITKSELPVILEGGNILCNDRLCFISAKVEENNAEHMTKIYAGFKRRFSQSLHSVPVMPKEPNGHIDLWAKFLKNRLLAIAEIEPATLALLPPESRAFYLHLQAFLNQQATGKDQQGQKVQNSIAVLLNKFDPEVKIVRIPLPLPLLMNDITFFRSYINSILVNGKVILPRFQRLSLDDGIEEYPDRNLTDYYEKKVEKVYSEAGYKPVWVNADHLVIDGGTWHCLAAQVPRL